MKELIPISEHNGKKAVSARVLYSALGYEKSQFSRWSKKHIIENRFAIENEDYAGFDTDVEGNTVPDYALSLSFAKKLCMLSKTKNGEKYRDYLIECERIAQESVKPKVITTAEMFLQNAQLMVEHENRISHVEEKIHELESKSITRPSTFAVAGYASFIGMHVNLRQAKDLGRRASEICRKRNIDIDRMPDPRFGEVNLYPDNILKEVFEDYFKNDINFRKLFPVTGLTDLEDIGKVKQQVNSIESRVLRPNFKDTRSIPVIYSLFKRISKNLQGFPKEGSMEFKHRFMFVVIMLFSPRFFAGEFLIRGIRDELAELFKCSGSHISNMCRNLNDMYKKSPSFKRDTDYIIDELLRFTNEEEKKVV